MQINDSGITLKSFNEIVQDKAENLSKDLGEEIALNPENLIINLIVSFSQMQHELEKSITFLLKQFDPKTAEGEYQNAIYSRVGLKRITAIPTTFTLNIRGEIGTTLLENELCIKDNKTGIEFLNTENIEYIDNTNLPIKFKCVLDDSINVNTDTSFEIVDAPQGIIGIEENSIDNILIGNEEEKDSEFRERFFNLKNIGSKCTRNSILNNLSKLTNGLKFIRLYDINNDETLPAGTLFIVAKPEISDTEFCKAILYNTLAGINFSGNTTINIPISNGDEIPVSFQKATPVEIELDIVIKIKSGYYENSVIKNSKNSILEYAQNKVYGLEETVYASEFIIPLLKVNGTEAIISVSVKRQNTLEYTDSVSLERDEYAVFNTSDINITVN